MSTPGVDFWQKAALLFDSLIETPREERQIAIAALTDPPEVIDVLQRLFSAHDRAAEHTGSAVVAAVGAELREFADEQDTLPAGSMIGPFQIVRLLGAGGMGQVYLATRQIEERQQHVAIKLPNRRAAPAAMARFRQERAILASLDHPAIARLVDVGDSAERPYLAMEYVAGETISDHCARQRWPLVSRVRAALALLAGLQYAHERLVVHRDIKAANILVDASGQPRILDFGIGKALDEGAASTADGQRYFSLACAAPEQIRGQLSSAATDVYAVAALVYELLCGAPPLEFQDLSVPDALDHALHKVPPLASQRFSDLSVQRQAQIAAERRASPAQVLRFLKGDIDTVLARALRKEPQHRYATAQAFADDLAAILDSRPIAARSGERWYRSRRFLKRHRVAAGLIALTTTTVMASVVALWLQANDLRHARDDAEARRMESERVVEFLRGLFRQADPVVARGRELTAKSIVDRGIADLETDLQDEPAARGRLLDILSEIQLSLGDWAAAQRLANESLAMAVDRENADRAQLLLARIAFGSGNYAAAVRHADAITSASMPSSTLSDIAFRALIVKLRAQQQLKPEPIRQIAEIQALIDEASRRFGPESREAREMRVRLAFAHGALGDAQAESALLDEITSELTLDNDSVDPQLATLALQRASVLRARGQLDEARTFALWALKVQTRVYGVTHPELTHSLSRLGNIEKQANNADAAQRYYETAVAICESAMPADSPRTAGMRFNLGSFLLHQRGDAQAALPLLQAAYEQTVRSGTSETINAILFGIGLAQAYADTNQPEAARTRFQAALDALQPLGEKGVFTRDKTLAELACLTPENISPQRIRESIRRIAAEEPGDETIPRLHRCLERGSSRIGDTTAG